MANDSETAAVLMHLTQQVKALVAELKLIREQLLQPEEMTDGTEASQESRGVRSRIYHTE